MARSSRARDPWRRVPVGELGDQLLPRWFVLLAIAAIPVAIAAVILAFVAFSPLEVPVAARRPPPEPGSGLTTGVGDLNAGDLSAVAYDNAACPVLDGVGLAGTDTDRAVLVAALEALCGLTLPGDIAAALAAFAQDGTIRFAQFAQTGVDSTATVGQPAPEILVNAKFLRTDPTWIAPVLVHEVSYRDAEPDASTASSPGSAAPAGPGTVAGALVARQAEALICERLFSDRRPSRGCDDAAALLALPDPAAALRAAGFQ